jgi:hypothetical protein
MVDLNPWLSVLLLTGISVDWLSRCGTPCRLNKRVQVLKSERNQEGF